MIYAVNKRTKEHRVCLPENSDNFLRGAFIFTADEKLVQADPDGWIERREDSGNPLPEDTRCDALLWGRRVVPYVIAHGNASWEGVTHYRPILEAKNEPEAPAWDGAGVPAAGLQVDCKDMKTPMWTRCQVVFSSDYVVVVEAIEGHGKGAQVALDVLGTDGLGRLRPARSKTQCEIEELKKDIMRNVGDALMDDEPAMLAEALHKIGYRKQGDDA